MNRPLKLAFACLLWGLCGIAFAADSAPDAAVFSGLSRLTLREAERLFAQHNREVQIAQRAVEGALADTVAAGQIPNPDFSIGAAQIPRSNGQSIGSGSLRDKHVPTVIGLTQLFERGDKRQLRIGAAEQGVEASRKDLLDVRRQQRVALAGAYFDLLLAQEKEKISAETAGLFGKTLDAVELRLKAGDVAASDVSRIRVDALRAQNDARAARADREKAQAALAYLIGAERHANEIAAVDEWPEVATRRDPLPLDEMLENRADVAGAQARVRAAEKQRELARALRTRDITAGVQYEHFPDDAANNTLGVSISIPLFTNYYFEGEIRRAEVALQAANDNVERVRALARGEVAKARADLEAAAERVGRFQGILLREAQKSAEAAEFAYSKGAIGVMDLLDARRTLRATRIEATIARADYARSLAAWQAAITPASALQ